MSKLKVYVTTIIQTGPQGEYKQWWGLVAAASRKNAGELLGQTDHWMKSHSAVTANERDIQIGMSRPGTVFLSGMNYPRKWYFEEEKGVWKESEVESLGRTL